MNCISPTFNLRCVVGMTAAACVAAAAIAGDSEPSHGELAAAIRAANLPCAHVLEVSAVEQDTWAVRCNSGRFEVSRAAGTGYVVVPAD